MGPGDAHPDLREVLGAASKRVPWGPEIANFWSLFVVVGGCYSSERFLQRPGANFPLPKHFLRIVSRGVDVGRRWLDRLSDLARASPGEAAMLALTAAAIVGGSLFVYARTRPPPPPIHEVLPSTPAPAEKLLVHVAGLVANPGVYELPDGSRVKDALLAAGGAAEGADLDSLNLAARVADGERVFVPKKGDPPTTTGSQGQEQSSKVNLNTATAEQLEGLPGVGPVLAQRIVDYRAKRGRFTSIRQLMEVEGIGDKKFASLKDRVTV